MHDDQYSNIHLNVDEKAYLCSRLPPQLLTVSSTFSTTAVTDLIGFLADLTSSCSTIKIDTACSYSMSGDPTRLTTISAPPDSIMVKGFNNTSSSVAATGFNTDSKPELYVPGMPEDLLLLCAADYTTSGATILLPNEGYVLSLSPDHQQYLRDYAHQHDIIKTLTVHNNTYEVAPDPVSSPVAYNSIATKYFNSKVNVSTA